MNPTPSPLNTFTAAKYRSPETGRVRWAVLTPGGLWHFPNTYGERAAKKVARRLNKQAA